MGTQSRTPASPFGAGVLFCGKDGFLPAFVGCFPYFGKILLLFPTMLKRIQRAISTFYFSLPIQLLVVQVRFHKLLLLPWLFLFLTVTNQFGESFGVPYLFLRPEYVGSFSFGSMFLLGCGIGAFVAAYQIVSYISTSYRFYFLAVEHRPFGVFFMNNLLLPFSFLIVFSISFIHLQVFLDGYFTMGIIWKLLGTYLGGLSIMLLIFLYFATTNKNIVQILGEKVVTELKSRRVILQKARAATNMRNRIDVYFTGFFRITRADTTSPADFRLLVRILNQNHGNALFLELILLVIIMALGLMEEKPIFQIPAGSSILLLLSVFLMFTAAFTFWLRRLGPILLLVLVGGYFAITQFQLQHFRHQALGMVYDGELAEYSLPSIYQMQGEKQIEADKIETIKILNRWKADYELYNGREKLPKIVFLSVSGGGLRSSYFSFRVMQILQQLTNGKFMERTRLITGASGGMIGAAYFRELFLKWKLGQISQISDPSIGKRLSKDMLNRVAFKIVSGIFLPTLTETVGGLKYHSDRGYSFDAQMAENLPEFKNKRLGDYVYLEEYAIVPMMMFTPIVINDGRTLYLSSTHMSYMTRNQTPDGNLEKGFTGIEFRRFFEKQWADSLLFTTALRMNASFPFITPYIQLPSNPPLQLIDAGVADNYGIQNAVKFMYVFREWLNQNTSGVLLLQIRDSKKPTDEIPEFKPKTLLEEFLDPISATYSSFSNSKEMTNDDYLNFAHSWLGTKMKFLELEYNPPDSAGIRASLSWHLTDKEIEGIERSLVSEKNQESIRGVMEYLADE